MTVQQGLAFAVLAATMGLFIWGKLRYDVVAIIGLLAAVIVGVVPDEEAFSGFSDDIVIIVGSALVVSAGVARSGVIERIVAVVSPRIGSFNAQLILLVAAVAVLSAFVKNIGALAMMMPIAFQMAKRSGSSISCYLMPMAFASLLGGLITMVGTSPNVIVSRMREELVGEPFAMFDYTPVGLAIAAAGVAFLCVGYRLLPGGQTPATPMGQALDITNYVTEARVLAGSNANGKTIEEFARETGEDVLVISVLRDGREIHDRSQQTLLTDDDIVLLEGAPEALEQTIAAQGLELEGENRPVGAAASSDDVGVIEAVVGHNSVLIGQAAGRFALHARYDLNLLAISRSGVRFNERLRAINLRAGDVIVIQGTLSDLPARLVELGCLPLAERELRLGSLHRSILPVLILGGAMALTATGFISVQLAFFAAAGLMVITGALPVREAYNAVDWPILIMLAALIPVSEAIRTTGGTTLIAGGLSELAQSLPPFGALALILVAAMAVTPFLNNAATVLVMAPIAASFAGSLGYKPDAFLMAVAVGAACDFLTPIGHQCNTLVMGPGGYRFGDYWRLGLPLSILVVVLGTPLIALVWPMS